MSILNTKAKNLLKNLNYTFTANFLVLGISVLLNLLVPKFIGVREYSYWQLYVFYTSYVGFLHFGWLDGIYLKDGGKEYDQLDKDSLGSQFWYLLLLELVISLLIVSYALFFSTSSIKKAVLILTAFVSIIRNLNTFVLYIFQTTNRIKEYAQLSRNDRYLYTILLASYLLIGGRNFFVLICLDVFSRVVITFWGFFKIKDILLRRVVSLRMISAEIFDNIKIGSNLMLSNIAGMLIIGISRILIEYKWNVETFGKLSLTLSISNMFMTFINAVGVVMFPLLRRTSQKNLSSLYADLRNVFVPLSFFFLVFFQPIKFILELWLPSYEQSLVFMGILFPMIVYEGRMSLLTTTFLKTIRQEKKILYSNVIALIFAIIFSIFATILFRNLLLSVGVIIVSLILRCIIAEKILADFLNVKINIILLELFLTVIFIFSNIYLDNINSFFVYLFLFLGYIILVRKKSINSINRLFKLIRT